jgi:hypothetical protein
VRPLALTLVLASCSGAAQRAAPMAPIDSLGADLPPQPLPTVHLIDGGHPPRVNLTYAVTRGHTETLVLELGSSLSLTIGDMTPPEVRAPTLRLTVELRALDSDSGGRSELEGAIRAAEIPAGPEVPQTARAALAPDLQRLVGLRFRMLISRRGVLERMSLAAPEDASGELITMVGWLREAVGGLLPVLPSDPVGPGGRWQVRRRVAIGPAVAEQNNVYSVLAVEGGQTRLSVRLGLTAGAQRPSVAGLPPGASVVLASLAGSGGGQLDLDLGRLAQRQELRWSSTAVGTAQPRGEPSAQVRMTTSGSLVVKPELRPAAAR